MENSKATYPQILRSLVFFVLVISAFGIGLTDSRVLANGPTNNLTKGPLKDRKPSNSQTVDYNEVFKLSRQLLIQDLMTPKHQLQKRFKDLSETQVIEHLQNPQEDLSADANPSGRERRELIKQLTLEAQQTSDPSKHLRLIPPPGKSGYSELQFYVSHPYSYTPVDSQKEIEVPAADLVSVWKTFLESAHKQIVLNVYDFDLESIAQTLIDQGRKGLDVRVGIDQDVIAKRPPVKAIADRLKASGVVQITAVNSVGLNHQKMAAIDWEDIDLARVLFSSGNLTQSCLDPQGDLKGLTPLPPGSIPNANHVITMKSWLLSNLINHELSKTLDPGLQLRGAQYPMNGAYQVTGAEITDPANLLSEARPLHSMIISFTPGGGYRDVNANLIARLINESEGPIRVIQFAFSAEAVGEALLAKAQKAYLTQNRFDFIGVGDTPFAMQSWSQFLRLSGWKLLKDKVKKRKYYVEDSNTPFYKALTSSQWQDLRSKLFIGPRDYRSHTIQLPDGSSREVSAKIHHKILAIGNFAIVGTSFNFSKNAQNNNEQILVFNEPDLALRVDGMTRWLANKSGQTISAEVERRNSHNEPIVDEAETIGPGQ